MIKKHTSFSRVDGHRTGSAETRNALQTFFDELNQGQQKKILRNERVRPILEMYGIDTSSAGNGK